MSKNNKKGTKDYGFRLRMSLEEFDSLTQASHDLDKTKSQIIREALDMYYDYWFK